MDDLNIQGYFSNEDQNSQGESFKKPSVLQVGLIYSLAVALLIFGGSRIRDWDFNLGGLFTEFALVLLPPLLFLIVFRFDVKKVIRFNKTSFINIFLIFWIIVFSLPVVGVFNMLNHLLVKLLFGRVETLQLPIETGFPGILISVLVIGVSAGICEEVLFRGVIQRGFERFGAIKSILITALLFGLMHLDFQRLLGTFLLGALIGFLVYRSNSIISGMFAHFTNNSLAVGLSYYALKMNEYMKKNGIEGIDTSNTDIFSQFEKMPTTQLVGAIIVWAFIFISSAAFLIFLMYAFIKTTSKNTKVIPENNERVSLAAFLGLVPGLLLVAFIYVSKGLLLGEAVNPETIKNIFRAIGLG
ncbi:MAG: type II CAAX prenyl endopeptidase Rce1 family protein [Bacillota bacterium]